MDIKPTKPSLSQEASNALRAESGFSDLPSLMSQFTIRTMAGDLKNAALQAAAKLTATKTISPPAAPRGERSELYGAAAGERLYAAAPRDYLKIVPPPKEIAEPKTAPIAAPPLPKAEEEQTKKEKEAQGKKKQEQKAAEQAAKEAQKKLALEKKASQVAAAHAAKEAARIAKEKLLEAKRAQERELRDLLTQAKLKLAAKEFDAAIIDAQKIINHPASGWLAKWRAKHLINKAQKGIEEKTAESVIMPIAPAPSTQTSMSVSAPPGIGPRGDLSVGKEFYAAKPAPVPVNLPTVDETPTVKPAPSTTPLTPAPPVPPTPSVPTPIAPLFPPAPKPAPLTTSIPTTPPFPAKPSFQMPAGPLPDLLKTKAAEPEEVLDMKKVALVSLVAIAVLALIIGGLWYFLKQPQLPTQITQSPSPRPSLATQTPIPAPSPLFKSDSQKVFVLKTGQAKANFQEALAQLALTEEPAGNFIFLLFKDSAGQYLPLDNIAALAGFDLFNLPTQNGTSALKDLLDMRRFSFFTYSQAQTNSSPFTAQANVGRFGLIIKIQSTAATDQLVKSLRDLEQLMPADLKLLLADAKNRLPANPIFTDSRYQNVAIRFINFPTPDLSLDYAILNDDLIFGTSKESLRAAIDRILGP